MPDPNDPILLESRDGAVLTLRLNRPDRLNALSVELCERLLDAVDRADRDAGVGVVVIGGSGRAFCAGGDVKDMADESVVPSRGETVASLKHTHRLPQLMRSSGKVFIASINGPAFGAGLAISLSCDLRIAGRSARFGTAFAKVGLSGDLGMSYTLTQAVGAAHARRLLLSADPVDAERALALGLVDHLVEDDALDAATTSLARQYAEGPPLAYALIKRNLVHAEGASFAQSIAHEIESQATTMLSADHREAVAAFTAKRPGRYVGK
ncbi:MAG: enoyl-CoA hydratase [Sphingomonadales bacterium]|nr:MAG: enoyl-CoA hydratase [Sphingomonadales bacterium]